MKNFLKKVSEARGKKIIKQMIHARVGGSEPARGQVVIHASDLTKEKPTYCPRAVRLSELSVPQKKRPPQFLPVALSITFNEGRDKQARLNNDWLLDVMWGSWSCRGCANRLDWGVRPEYCEECESITNLWVYEEPRIIDYVSKVSGGLDALVDVGAKKLHVIECKIMKADQFKTLQAPLSEHRVRTRLYLRQIAGSKQHFAKEIETDYAHILYIMRGHGYKQDDGMGISPFKEFIVERDDSEVQQYLGMAHALTLSRLDTEKYGYPAGICKTQMCDRARICPVSKECFSEKPGTITWLKKDIPAHTGIGIKWITDGEKVNERHSI